MKAVTKKRDAGSFDMTAGNISPERNGYGADITISVVIPAYNRAKTIRRCLNSVLNQTFSPLEVIVVDDGSGDGTGRIVRDIADPRVRCIALDKNYGAQAARNYGIRESSGDWIAFQDSDDEWETEKLEKQVKALGRTKFDPMTVVHSDYWRFDSSSGQKDVWNTVPVDGADEYLQLLASQGPVFPAILTSKAALEKIGLLDEGVPSYQEWDTAIRLSRICRFIHISEPLFVYHLHTGETISKDKKRSLEGYQYILDKFRDEIVGRCGTKVFNRHLKMNALKAMRLDEHEYAVTIVGKSPDKPLDMYIISMLARFGMSPSFYEQPLHFVYRSASSLKRLLKWER